ncbi:MAG TPA: HIT family protein [Phycisphaerae bacterium]|nr:HIT family protein [Phycisphaerae bacterium]
MTSDPDCIFCRIAAGEIPCARLLAEEAAIAFLDIGPLARGHVLLVPREHYVTLEEMPAAVAAGMLAHLPALAAAVRKATGCQGYNVLQNNGIVAHQVVPHVHFHIIPRDPGDEFHFNWPAGSYAPGQIERVAEAIRRELGGTA